MQAEKNAANRIGWNRSLGGWERDYYERRCDRGSSNEDRQEKVDTSSLESPDLEVCPRYLFRKRGEGRAQQVHQSD